jgi:hypothetical protein
MCTFLAVLSLVAVPASVRPADPKAADSPTFVLRLKSIDDLIADAKYVAEMAGQGEAANQADGFLKVVLGDRIKAIDAKRPLGFYSSLNAQLTDSQGVILVPITSKKEFLAMLEDFNVTTEKNGDIYTVKVAQLPPPFSAIPIYLRMTDKYAFITAQNQEGLKNLLDPDKLFAAGRHATVSAEFHFDKIPQGIKQMALGQIDLRVADEVDKKQPGETEVQHALRAAVLKHLAHQVSTLIKDGGELALFFDVDQKAKELVVQATLSGKEGSTFTAQINDLGQVRSQFAGLLNGTAAVNLLLHGVMPKDVQKALGPVVDEGVKKALEKAKDETQREQGTKLLKALEPSLKAGELDTAFSLRGPNAHKLYTLVFGIKVKDGEGIDSAMQELAKSLPERDRELVKFNAETSDGVKIHRVEAQKGFDKQAKQVFGDNPIYFAVRADAIVGAAGPDGLTALKEALAAEPKAGPQVQVQVSLAHLAALLSRQHAGAVKAAEDAFGQDKDGDQVLFTVEGGKSLKVKLAMKAPVIRFLSKMDGFPGGKRGGNKAPKKTDDDN